jgi:hypothetical protein
MGVITTGNHPKALWPGIYKIWGLAYNQHALQCLDLFDEKTSVKNFEELVQSTSFGLASKKSQGGAVSYDSHSQGQVQRAIHDVYGLGYIVTREEIEDCQYAELAASRTRMLAQSMAQTKETVCANIFNRAFNSSYTYADGVEMCSTLNVNTSGGTWSNELAVGAVLSEPALEDMDIQIRNAVNDKGLRIKLKPQSLHIPTAEVHNAHRILNSTLQSGTANNDANSLRDQGIFPNGVKVNNYFDDTNNWFVRTDIKDGGLILFKRRAIEFTKDNDFDTENAKAKATERYVPTIGDKRAVYGSEPA